MKITLFDLAQRFVGTSEANGPNSNPLILAMLRLDQKWPEDDEVPWCSGAMNFWAWLLRLPRSKSLRARSWLAVGTPVALDAARPGFDIVVLARGGAREPGPETLNAPGHVGLFAGLTEAHAERRVLVLGGNQSNQVSIASFPVERVLGVRRLYEDAAA